MNKLNEDFHNILTALGVAHEAKDGGSATPAKGEETTPSAGDSTPASDGGDSTKAPDAGNFLSWLFQY